MDNLDVVTIGHAIVDILSRTDDSFLKSNGLAKGTMALVDDMRLKVIHDKLGPTTVMSGGSSANIAAGITALGGQAGYIGKVAEDQWGKTFRQDIRSAGVLYKTMALESRDIPTSRSLVMITPDGQRTMCTFLGASIFFEPADINEKMIRSAKVTCFEGYLFDHAQGQQSFPIVSEMVHKAGGKIALTLADPSCVDRHRDAFLNLIKNHVDILFANEAEIRSLYKTDQASDILPHCELAVITRGARGSFIIGKTGTTEIPPVPVAKIVDVTGAGDIYAAGFLYGYTQGKTPAECGRIASIAAAEIISQVGARPQGNFAQVLKNKTAV